MNSAMLLEYSGTAAVLIIGMVTCLALATRLKGAVFSLAGLFALAADSKLLGAQVCVLGLVERLGYLKDLRSQPWAGMWYYGWGALPVVLAALFAWHLWKRLRQMAPMPKEPACPLA